MWKLICILGLLLGTLTAASLPQSGTETRAFAPGGTLKLSLPVGSVDIRPGQDTKIVLHYFVRPPHHIFSDSGSRLVDLDFQVHGSDATVQLSYPDKGGNDHPSVDVILEVPARTSLDIELGVGKMTLAAGLQGDQHLKDGVGDIIVHGADRNRVATLDASTGVGSVHGGAWGDGQGFVAHELHGQGTGTYHLHAETGVGSVRIDP